MPDREKIIEGLEMSFRYSNVDEGNTLVPQQLVHDALTLLREQEPVAPVLQSGGNYVCGNCGMYTVGYMHPLTGESVSTWKYCGHCGRAVQWE